MTISSSSISAREPTDRFCEFATSLRRGICTCIFGESDPGFDSMALTRFIRPNKATTAYLVAPPTNTLGLSNNVPRIGVKACTEIVGIPS